MLNTDTVIDFLLEDANYLVDYNDTFNVQQLKEI